MGFPNQTELLAWYLFDYFEGEKQKIQPFMIAQWLRMYESSTAEEMIEYLICNNLDFREKYYKDR